MLYEEKVTAMKRINSVVKRSIAAAAAIFLFVFFALQPPYASAVEDTFRVNPESISGESEKEGNILSEYGFAVFTKESMSKIKAEKEKAESTQRQMVDGLFQSEWKGTESYDMEVQELADEADLFSMVDTGVETEEEITDEFILSEKMRKIIAGGILMCLISVLVIRWNRKKYERNHYNRAG